MNLKPLKSFVSNKKVLTVAAVIVAVAGFAYFIEVDFNFKKHDSIKEQAKQVVNVAQASEIHSDCEGKEQAGDKFDCYAQNFDSYMKTNGARKTLELMQALHDLGGYANANCHPLTHKIGNLALYVYGSVPNAAPEYIPTCHSGYYHGLVEEYLGTAPTYEQGIADVCGKPENNVYFNWFQCTHGLGHGIMQFRDNELPQSLKDCDFVDPANQAREICYAGAFMENITTDEKTGHPAKYIKKEDPLYPCNAAEIEDKYRSACYFLASSQILKVNNYDMRDAFVQCARVENRYRHLCFQSLGRDVSGSSLRDKAQVIEKCQYGADAQDNANCFYGAVRDFINEKGEFQTGIDLCVAIPSKYRQQCFEAVYYDMTLYKKGQEFLDICAKMPEPYSGQCRTYAR